MSTRTDKVRQAIERAMARIGCPPGDNADADLYHEMQSALSELEAQPSAPTVDQIMEVVDPDLDWSGGPLACKHRRIDLHARLTKLLTNT